MPAERSAAPDTARAAPPQRRIPRGIAVAPVDLVEPDQLEHDHGERRPLDLRALALGPGQRVEVAVGVEHRHAVGHPELGEAEQRPAIAASLDLRVLEGGGEWAARVLGRVRADGLTKVWTTAGSNWVPAQSSSSAQASSAVMRWR